MSQAVRHRYTRTLAGGWIMRAMPPALSVMPRDPRRHRFAAVPPWSAPVPGSLPSPPPAESIPSPPTRSVWESAMKPLSPRVEGLFCKPSLLTELLYRNAAPLLRFDPLPPILTSSSDLACRISSRHGTTMRAGGRLRKRGSSSYIQAVCGLRFLYTNTLHLQIDIARIPLPRYKKKRPLILSPGEVKLLLEAPKNIGHRAMLTTMYAAGPRVSEVSRLKVPDIDSGRGVIWIRGGKGHKDRQTLLPPKLLELLRVYYRWKRLQDWLFPGEKPGQTITSKSIYLACRQAAQMPASPRRFIRTLYGTPLPPTCSKRGWISAPFRSYSAIRN